MIETVIFDLSEVLIAGLVGIEKPLAVRLQIREEAALPPFRGDLLHDLCCGTLSEDSYLARIIEQQQWSITPDEVKDIIRRNFHRRVSGIDKILERLLGNCDLVLLSDHAAEWVTYIKSIHPFLRIFKAQFFSFDLRQTKRESSTFRIVIDAIHREPKHCIFVDDSTENVATATSVGISSIRFTSAQDLSRKLVELGV